MSYQQKMPRPYRQIKRCRSQQGVVIVVALFMVALVASMAYVMMARLERDIERTRLILRNTEAELAAQGSVVWAKDILRQDWEHQQTNQRIDVLPQTFRSRLDNGFRVVTRIEDAEARYNLNNLLDINQQTHFQRLLQAVMPAMRPEKAIEITQAISDWLMPDAGNSALNQYYLAQPVPYRAAHRLMISVSELRLVKGVTASIYAALKDWVMVLPQATKINVQTARALVLMTLSPSMTEATARQVMLARQTRPMNSIQAFLTQDAVKAAHVSASDITVVSSYFLVRTEVQLEKQQLVLYTLLERAVQNRKARMSTVWQSKGVM